LISKTDEEIRSGAYSLILAHICLKVAHMLRKVTHISIIPFKIQPKFIFLIAKPFKAQKKSTHQVLFHLSGSVLLSQGDSPQLPSALRSLTSVFGMGTGVTFSLSPPDYLVEETFVPSKLDNV
jgi:hypothetical protein